MRRAVSLVVLLFLVVVIGSRLPAHQAVKSKPEPEAKGPPLSVGNNLPATFHPYNVTARIPPAAETEEADKEAEKTKTKTPAATTKGKFHCLISEYDLDPVVMLFVRGREESAGLKDLLKKLEGAIERNPGVRLRCFVVFVSDDIANVAEEDDKRKTAEENIQKIADGLKLKSVVLTLASKNDVAKYQLDPDTALTAVLYKSLRIEAVHKVSRDQLDKEDSEAVKAILTDVAGKLKATR
jgi:hypothetical protein